MKNANAAVDELELEVLVQVEDDPGDDPEDVEDVEDCDGDQDGCQEAAEVAVLPVLDDHNEEEGYRLHVADLDSNAGKRDLEKLFGRYGPLKEIWMARSVPCFAFVVFRYREDAEESQRKADGSEVCGRRIRVTVARPRTRGRGRRGFDPGMRCYQCGERGHFSRDCPDSKWGYRRPPSPRRSGRDEGGRDRRRF